MFVLNCIAVLSFDIDISLNLMTNWLMKLPKIAWPSPLKFIVCIKKIWLLRPNVESAVTLWLTCWTPDRVVPVQALATSLCCFLDSVKCLGPHVHTLRGLDQSDRKFLRVWTAKIQNIKEISECFLLPFKSVSNVHLIKQLRKIFYRRCNSHCTSLYPEI